MSLVSVVIPIYDEAENLPHLHRRLLDALGQIGEPWEVIFVDDGSRDESPRMMREIHRSDDRFKLLRLSRNFGHQPAATAGMHHARGDCVIMMDGDLQDPPELIPALLARWREGYRVVLAERRSRADGGTRGLGFRLFYPIYRRISDFPGAPDAGIYCLMDRQMVKAFNQLPERNRFIPGLRDWLGYETASVPYDRQKRASGAPKQTLRNLVRYAIDGLLSFSTKPLRVATWLGMLVSVLAFGLGVFYFVTFFTMQKAVTGFTTLIVSLLFLGGAQLLCIGILGEYIGRIYEESKQRPLYIVQEAVGLELAAADRGRLG